MAVFKIPETLCNEVSSLIARFWWGGSEKSHKIHWQSWNKMCTSKLSGGMGFRNLKDFNLAMLAKQGWRIITNPTSLVSRILKVKYFPRSSFLEARLGNCPSYTWRSILEGREVLKKGIRWRVGNGESIDIWKDKWIPRPTTFKAISPKNVERDNIQVAELINRQERRWDIEMVQQILPMDAEYIKSIPLGPQPMEDSMVWHYTRSGKYSVKSGYHIEGATSPSPESSDSTNLEVFWKKLWTAKVPNRVKCFAWRAFQSCIPVMDNLYKRKIQAQPWCLICRKGRETVIHCLKECEYARSVWKLQTVIEVKGKTDIKEEIFQWALEMSSNLKHREWEFFLFIIWSLWNNRNATICENRRRSPKNLLEYAGDYMQKFHLGGNRVESGNMKEPPVCTWKPPKVGWLKANFDGAYRKDGKAGIGVVIRDERGQVLASYLESNTWICNAEAIEALSGYRALELAKSMGLKKLQLEGDALAIIRAINSQDEDKSYIGGIIESSKKLIKNFEAFSCIHTRRTGNTVAHALARQAIEREGKRLWLYEFNPIIDPIVSAECGSFLQ